MSNELTKLMLSTQTRKHVVDSINYLIKLSRMMLKHHNKPSSKTTYSTWHSTYIDGCNWRSIMLGCNAVPFAWFIWTNAIPGPVLDGHAKKFRCHLFKQCTASFRQLIRPQKAILYQEKASILPTNVIFRDVSLSLCCPTVVRTLIAPRECHLWCQFK